MAETRKLAAILVSDVVGYSRLTGSDEDRILRQWRAANVACGSTAPFPRTRSPLPKFTQLQTFRRVALSDVLANRTSVRAFDHFGDAQKQRFCRHIDADHTTC
jgi:hypothetical protein